LFLLFLTACTDPALLPCDEITERLEGLVVDMAGSPIVGASVRVGWSEVFTDEQGRFITPNDPGSRWVEVSADGYVARTRPAIPDDALRVRLHTEELGVLSMVFGGDVMAGRRFLDPNEDGDNSDALIQSASMSDDLWSLLKPISPLLNSAELSSINLEGPLLTEGAQNPAQENPWFNPPELAQALARAGVDIANIANNHSNDFLEQGISATIQRLENAELIHLGAGLNFDAAWAGHHPFVSGSPMAMISCSLLYEEEGANSDAAEENEAGVAECTVDDLRTAIIEARNDTDFIVVQIHGGVGYTDSPSYSMRQMVLTAGEAGASLIVGHGPHVLQGVNETEGAFVAWSMGNLLFDQELWASLPTGLLQVHVNTEDGKVRRATFEPLLLQNYAPVGIRGRIQEDIAREFAARSGLPAVVDDGAVEFDLSGVSWISQTGAQLESEDGWSLPEDLQGSYVNNPVVQGRARVGRDLLLGVGNFEDVDLRDECGPNALWDQGDPRSELHAEAAKEGLFGMRHSVTRYSVDPARSRPQHRIPVGPESSITLSGWIRGNGPGHVEIRFYPDTSSEAISSHALSIETTEEWAPFKVDTFIPSAATHMLPFVGAEADGKRASVDIDSLRFIAWSPDLETQMERYDYLQVDGSIDYQLSRRLWPGMADLGAPSDQ